MGVPSYYAVHDVEEFCGITHDGPKLNRNYKNKEGKIIEPFEPKKNILKIPRLLKMKKQLKQFGELLETKYKGYDVNGHRGVAQGRYEGFAVTPGREPVSGVNENLKDLALPFSEFCKKNGVELVQDIWIKVSFGYGLTETSSGVAISVRGDPYAMDICPGVELSLAEDGEILIKAPGSMMEGYYKQPEATAQVLKDGLLYTGDLGCFDWEGKIHITGRKKEILVLPDGTKLFLPEYEAAIAQALGSSELAVSLKDGRPCLVYSGQADKQELWEKLKPLMDSMPRGRQLAGIELISSPLPRTATGKLKRWELEKLLRS